jgi:hypothetical protein
VTKPPVKNAAIDGGTAVKAKTHPFSELIVDYGIFRVSKTEGYQPFVAIHRFRMYAGEPRGRRAGRKAPPPRLNCPTSMGSGPDKTARSPTPPEADDDGEEWPVQGIVGEDVDVFGFSRY